MTIAKSFKRTWMRKRITSKNCVDPQRTLPDASQKDAGPVVYAIKTFGNHSSILKLSNVKINQF